MLIYWFMLESLGLPSYNFDQLSLSRPQLVYRMSILVWFRTSRLAPTSNLSPSLVIGAWERPLQTGSRFGILRSVYAKCPLPSTSGSRFSALSFSSSSSSSSPSFPLPPPLLLLLFFLPLLLSSTLTLCGCYGNLKIHSMNSLLQY